MKYARKALMVIATLFLGAYLNPVNAEVPKIEDYVFTWHVAKSGDAALDVEKTQDNLRLILRTPGGALGRVSANPSQAEKIGEVLSKTEEYYDNQVKSQDSKSEDMVPAGEYKVYFSSNRGRNFKVSVRGPKAIGGAALMGKKEALTMSGFLLQAEELADLVNKKINP